MRFFMLHIKFMRVLKYSMAIVFFTFGVATITLTTGCKTKEGCGLEKKYAPDMESKGGKSQLFSKKQRKKMK